MPFGAAIAVLGLQLGVSRPPWLPHFLLRRPIQPSTLAAILRAVERVVRPVERLLRPRWLFLFGPVMHAAAGVAIAVAALLLFPPLPMPGINALPSLAIVLLALGLMERDGAAVAAGYAVLVASYAYLYLVGCRGEGAASDRRVLEFLHRVRHRLSDARSQAPRANCLDTGPVAAALVVLPGVRMRSPCPRPSSTGSSSLRR